MTQLTPYYLEIGQIMRPHGVRGELRMKVRTDYPERVIQDLKTVYLGRNPLHQEADAYELESARFHKDHLLLKFAGIDDRTEAEMLRGLRVMVDIDDAVPLEEDEFYLYEVIGLTVRTADDIELGTIRSVIETGANDVYVVKGRAYGEVLIPAHDETIVEIDFDAGVLTVSLPDGLLPDD